MNRFNVVLAMLLLSGCALVQPVVPDEQLAEVEELRVRSHQRFVPESSSPPEQPVSAATSPVQASETLFTFEAEDLDLRQALQLFAAANDINMIVDKDVVGNVDADFRDLGFDEAMQALLDSQGYYWFRKGALVHVRSWETRTFTVDYIRLVRSGSGSSQAQVSSGSSEGDTGGSESTAGTMTIQQTDKVDFWEELEQQLATLKSEAGRLVTNRLAGTVQVTDQHRRVEEIGNYLDQIKRAVYRQVDIEVKIIEVTLNDDFSLGIDWSRLVSGGTGSSTDFNINGIVNAPAGGIDAIASGLEVTFSDIGSDGTNDLTGVLNALQEQGEVQIVSQPHVRTLNNQSALIKVGTDRTFFRKEQVTDATNAGSQTFSTDVPQVVTEGIVLSITPQISIDGWVTMDVSPVVTRVSSVSEVVDASGNVQSTAPNLDISQASSLVRARSGETIVIGGLIQTQESYTNRGVPGLRKIPGLGALFAGTYKADQQKELVMFLTPRVVK